MKNKSLIILSAICLTTFMSCSQKDKAAEVDNEEKSIKEVATQEPHRYGGWYCPDNLIGFPAVDIEDWKNVPVVNGRMATQEETQNGSSLIFVDLEKYPNAKPLEMIMPKLARFYNQSTKKEELVIIIQALNISNDSIVGFRYLNGGNGSARLSEVKILNGKEITKIVPSRFVSQNIEIKASPDKIWGVLTNSDYLKALQPIFDTENKLKSDWIKTSKVNYKYLKAGEVTSAYADELFGNYYIQIDCESSNDQYVEKFLLLENQETKSTELKLVCGPFSDDFDKQKVILNKWANKVKELSEK